MTFLHQNFIFKFSFFSLSESIIQAYQHRTEYNPPLILIVSVYVTERTIGLT